jgi:hypothetical protein
LVNGGLDASGRPDATLRCRRVIGTTAYGTDVPLVAGETTERDSSSGWVGLINRRLMNADILEVLASLRISGIGILEGEASTVLNDSAYTALTGTFTGGTKSDAVLTPSTTAAQFTYSGAASGRVLVLASGGSKAGASNVLVTGLYRNVTQSGGAVVLNVSSTNDDVFSVMGLIAVTSGDVISLRAATDSGSATWVNRYLSMVAIAIQNPPS